MEVIRFKESAFTLSLKNSFSVSKNSTVSKKISGLRLSKR